MKEKFRVEIRYTDEEGCRTVVASESGEYSDAMQSAIRMADYITPGSIGVILAKVIFEEASWSVEREEDMGVELVDGALKLLQRRLPGKYPTIEPTNKE